MAHDWLDNYYELSSANPPPSGFCLADSTWPLPTMGGFPEILKLDSQPFALQFKMALAVTLRLLWPQAKRQQNGLGA